LYDILVGTAAGVLVFTDSLLKVLDRHWHAWQQLL
jgi:hypothetical protein